MSFCGLSRLLPCSKSPESDAANAYYRSQTLNNFHTLYPNLSQLRIVSSPGFIHIVSTIDGGRQVTVHSRTYCRLFPGAEERAVRGICAQTKREVRKLEKRSRDRERKALLKEVGLPETRDSADSSWGPLEKEVGTTG